MPRPKFLGPASRLLLGLQLACGTVGCHDGGGRAWAGDAGPPKAPDLKPPGRIAGTVSLRAGLAAPDPMTVEIVIRRGSDPEETFASHVLRDVRTWPSNFEFAVRWPNFAYEGEVKDWKASPSVLSVFARASVDGRVAFLSERQSYTADDSARGRPLRLTLNPVME